MLTKHYGVGDRVEFLHKGRSTGIKGTVIALTYSKGSLYLKVIEDFTNPQLPKFEQASFYRKVG